MDEEGVSACGEDVHPFSPGGEAISPESLRCRELAVYSYSGALDALCSRQSSFMHNARTRALFTKMDEEGVSACGEDVHPFSPGGEER